ncbi:hypothetical protein FHX48_000458 [Microbacterium halimionae]|uniref:F5/8 type C domain-containing protein n=1 Tax=Microbacterium halimionae TaxID=1526413 RepID=A0A7W3JM39_9MICO|nr:hypothetical protein [Microbacterium halimionae]MBA8815406.1 hypothetical protein [Microbacterium halimionae]NII95453.1 hypothetical protein [Microbacterium halimionae]
MQVSSQFSTAYGGDNLTDGDCTNAGRWLSATGDSTPTATVSLDAAQYVPSVGIYSGYTGGSGVVIVDFTVEVHTSAGWQQVASITGNASSAREIVVGIADVDGVRLAISNPSASTTEAKVARVYELAIHE